MLKHPEDDIRQIETCISFDKLYVKINIILTYSTLILVGNQLDAQFLLCCVYLNPLHVSRNCVHILRRTTVLIQHLV